MIKSKCGRIFGGYTSAPWTSLRGYKKDEKAFLFSLTQKIKYKAKDQTNNKVGHTPEYLIVFGKPNDLWLKADCDVQKNPYRIAKYIYTLQEDMNGTIVERAEEGDGRQLYGQNDDDHRTVSRSCGSHGQEHH